MYQVLNEDRTERRPKNEARGKSEGKVYLSVMKSITKFFGDELDGMLAFPTNGTQGTHVCVRA